MDPGASDHTRHALAPFERDVLTSTGRPLRIRPAAPSDAPRLQAFYDGLSDTSNYYRFFGIRRFIPPDELVAATHQDPARHVTLVVDADDELIGTGEYHAMPGGEEAEVAFAVTDVHQHEGIGTLLLEDLAMIARAAGFRRLVALTMPGNKPMRRVFQTAGLTTRQWFEDGVCHVQLDLTADHLMQDGADLRDWRSAVESLRPFLQPTHVVVIGAGQAGRGPGHRILDHLRTSFTGRVSVVHPTAGAVAGVDAVRRVGDLLPAPDLAIIAVPAEAVAGVVAECGTAGVPAAVVISAGFAERDAAGERRQASLLATARSHGMRIVGPNCLGIVSTRCGLDATFTDQTFPPGGIAVAAQSGGVGIAIAAEAERRGAGMSAFVSMGNKIDVSSNDLLRAWAEDDATTVVVLYLESFGDPQRFARVARAVSRRKPVLAVKGGRSEAGRRGARSHTAAMADDDAVVDALFEHTGVLRTRTLEELVDAALLFDSQGTVRGPRVALIGNAGGPLILGADTAADHDLTVPELSATVRAQIDAAVPGAAATGNPIDLTSAMTTEQLATVTAIVGRSGEVDACILAVVDVDASDACDGSADAGVELGADVPVVVAHAGHRDPIGRGVPRYPSIERAAVAVGHSARRARWLATVAADAAAAPSPSLVDADSIAAARRIVRGASPSAGWLPVDEAFELIAAVGVPVVPWHYARTAVECTRAATTLAAPYVVKGDVDRVLHKRDEGAVLLRLRDAEEANEAYWDLAVRFGPRLRGAIVQSQAAAGVEMLVGVVRRPGFGPVVVVGAGGTDAELLHDRAVLIAPVSIAAAARAIEHLRMAPLLHGYRGRPRLPVGQVAELVHRISVLAAAVPDLEQVDLNPVIVTAAGCTVVDVRVAVGSGDQVPGPLRGLRGHPVGDGSGADPPT